MDDTAPSRDPVVGPEVRVVGQMIPVLLMDRDAIPRDQAPSFDVIWEGTKALLEWIAAASAVAGQPLPLEVIAESSGTMNPAAPTAEQLGGDKLLANEATENAFVREVLLCATVMAAYLLACPLENLTHVGPDPVGSIVPLLPNEELTAVGLCKLVLVCAPCKEILAEIVAPFLYEIAPLRSSPGFMVTFSMERLILARTLADQVRASEIAHA